MRQLRKYGIRKLADCLDCHPEIKGFSSITGCSVIQLQDVQFDNKLGYISNSLVSISQVNKDTVKQADSQSSSRTFMAVFSRSKNDWV